MNRLAREKSPYLLQHADNPVDWYPWGDEAFAAAKKNNRPIFLSIGYSTCHWCHVMAHESFEDAGTAAVMNQHFINIKIDREERPDVDAIYMNAVQMISGSGGWPMSVWLTPELKPFYAGTYFPPDDRHGRPGFKGLLLQISEVWEKEKEKVVASSDEITALLKQKPTAAAVTVDVSALMEKNFKSLKSMYDPQHAGFGRAPKFPMPVYLSFLLDYYRRTGTAEALEMAVATMRRLRRGGIYDQLGGGFARYSTDERWVVPHFEKMLYDNAQLITVAADLFRVTGDMYFRHLAEHALEYVLRDLIDQGGAFHSAEDADSEGKEGTFYLWTLKDIKDALPGELGDIAAYHFGVTPNGNFFDPHTGESGKNVLVLAHEAADIAAHFKRSQEEVQGLLDQIYGTLFSVREKRPRPHRDDKILTEWNGLMISALAHAARQFEAPSYRGVAENTANFIFEHLYDAPTRRLYRRWRDGDRQIPGQQADYAMLIQGLLDLFEVSGTARWLAWAAELQKTQDELFFDPEHGGYFMNVAQEQLVVRLKDEADNVIPSGNSIAVSNGLRLSKLLDDNSFYLCAEKTIKYFSERLNAHPGSLTAMTSAVAQWHEPPRQLILLGKPTGVDMRELKMVAREAAVYPLTVLVVAPGQPQEELAKLMPFVKSMSLLGGRATAYFCENYACQAPTADAATLKRALEAVQPKK